MKNIIYKFLIWCSGSNSNILDNEGQYSDTFQCGKSERIKHAWIGALVLIPTTFAFIGMLYASTTLELPKFVYPILAIIWAGIIFIIDRYIVATFRKSNSIKNDLFSIVFITRLIFAIGVGLMVSDPLIQGVFTESIEQRLAEERKIEERKIDSLALIDVTRIQDMVNPLVENASEYKREINERIAEYDNKLSGEIDGNIGSGVRGDGISARNKRNIRNRLTDERNRQWIIDSTKISTYNSQTLAIQQSRDTLKNNLKLSNDYLAKRHALATLKNNPKNKDIKTITLFLALFLIFIDICCILFKAVTKKGSYDDYLIYEELVSDTELNIRKNELKSKLDASNIFNKNINSDLMFTNLKEIHKNRTKQDIIASIYSSEKSFNETLTREHIRFGHLIKKRFKEINKIKDKNIQKDEFDVLHKMIKSFYNSSNQALNKNIEE
tara:strand:- start:104 stop:1420 length:1317 start_codon:yes stop_codon:yes gene_type:complete